MIVLVVAAFALQNTVPVTVQLLAWSWQVDAGRLAAAAAAVGGLAVALVLGADDMRLRWQLRRALGRARRLEARLAAVESERDRLAEAAAAATHPEVREAASAQDRPTG
ncbi:MAG: DUF1049 domain-containing protein [Limnochordaceae bacterium]|nr:DUF1049 domain-containing protein [Limnochordaceae bacterium]